MVFSFQRGPPQAAHRGAHAEGGQGWPPGSWGIFAELPDPRRQAGQRHFPGDLLTLAIGAVIRGAEEFSTITEFGGAKRKWFRRFLRLPHGVASADPFERVFARLDPEALERCFASRVKALAGSSNGEWIAIDGKTLRGSFDRADKKAAIRLVSAWASTNRLCFGQLACEAKSNEITAIPRLPDCSTSRAATIDAMGCQREIARQGIAQGVHDVLTLKGNQDTLYQEVQLLFDEAIAKGFGGMAHHCYEQTEGDHGRIQIRRARCTSDLAWFEDRARWAGLRGFAAVECERTVGKKTTCERRYFISSHEGTSVENIAQAVRNHWQVANGLHWSLDVSFAEEKSRVPAGHAAENLSRVRRIALNLLRAETVHCKRGIKTKRLRAGWDEPYLCQILRIRECGCPELPRQRA